MKKKIWAIVILAILAITAIILPPSNSNSNVQVSAASSKYYIHINPKNKSSKYAYPNEAGAVYFTISISQPAENDVDIYYETKDKSAIASLGDYTEKAAYATIPKNETTVDIVV